MNLWWMNPIGGLEPLVVVNEMTSSVYVVSPLDGAVRRLPKRLLRNGSYRSAAIGATVFDEAGRAALFAWKTTPRQAPDGARDAAPPRASREAWTLDTALAALGLAPPCTVADVRRAFRERAKTAHPDAGGSDAAFIALRRSYEQALMGLGGAP